MTAGFELVVHHRYTSGTCADLTGHANHGYAGHGYAGHEDAGPGNTTVGDADPQGLAFDGRTTRVVVFPALSLTALGGVRARARVWVDDLADRGTIMEGYLAFSFAVEPDGTLTGSVYTGLEWHLVTSPPATVPYRRWVDLAFVYDGRDHLALSVDGRTVAGRSAAVGRVGDVEWPYGLTIGAWPDLAARVFNGRMAEVWLWRATR
ncbi:hypothetical protein Acsp03_46670 [Actinomadura sp. NBRC 104412]|uniref:LamG-like jellyroll fold domain-containing protein n=1 Tax=Actinomadura sp. NBRC 104412 TaxID=3032203 RepID=UPI0024A1768F|nr:LamG-like jellyroll fold domain-containing protein [Actinomadura sp. NBRC 104412]GLZ07201.1 hypothetical protein Acsp03_46670 [Actinomadura sp. NBRC 104412]